VTNRSSLLWLQHELLQQVRCRGSVVETLANALPRLLRRVTARAGYVFSDPLPSEETLLYSYPRSVPLTQEVAEAMALAAAGAAPVATGGGLTVQAWSFPDFGHFALLRDEALPPNVAKALTPVLEALAAACATAKELDVGRAEMRRLTRSNELLRTLVDSVPEALVVTDEVGRLVFVNQPWSVFAGEAPERAVGQPLSRYVGEGSGRELAVAAIQDVSRGARQGCHLVGVPFNGATGLPVRAVVSLETIRNQAGTVRGAMGSIRIEAEPKADVVMAREPMARMGKAAPERLPTGATRPLALVVEDDAASSRVMSKMLQALGWRSVEVPDGRDALAAVEANAPDVVLMDINMAHVGGLEATRLIREREATSGSPPVPIVAVTAHTMKDDRATFLAAGMTGYLAKPVSLDALKTLLERHEPG
jgi:PAS domain S-box-containing protein